MLKSNNSGKKSETRPTFKQAIRIEKVNHQPNILLNNKQFTIKLEKADSRKANFSKVSNFIKLQETSPKP